MGIPGLLPSLEEIQERKHISWYKNKTAAIDAYWWLHKGAYYWGNDVSRGESQYNKSPNNYQTKHHTLTSTKLIQLSINRLKLLIQNKVRPIMIFDGGPLPIKSKTDTERK